MKNRESGFTLFELMIVIAIIVILSAIAVPNFKSWRDNANLRGSAFGLKSDLEMAKVRAIRGGGDVTVSFSKDAYEIKQSAGAGIIMSKKLNSVEIITDPSGYSIVFNNKGMSQQAGKIELKNSESEITITINRIGSISM